MRTWAKLVMLLAVLAFCMPAQGEILVYAKTLNCWWCDFIEPAEDPNYWDCDTENIKGFLILDVVYDANDEIDYIDNAVQIEYGRDDEGRWYWSGYEDTEVERLLCDDDIVWIFEDIEIDDADWFGAELFMVRGKRPRMVDIGLADGREEKREVVRQLSGNTLGLWFYLGDPDEKNMCTVKLRFQSKFTKWANDPDDGDQDLSGTRDAILEWLADRRYVGPS